MRMSILKKSSKHIKTVQGCLSVPSISNFWLTAEQSPTDSSSLLESRMCNAASTLFGPNVYSGEGASKSTSLSLGDQKSESMQIYYKLLLAYIRPGKWCINVYNHTVMTKTKTEEVSRKMCYSIQALKWLLALFIMSWCLGGHLLTMSSCHPTILPSCHLVILVSWLTWQHLNVSACASWSLLACFWTNL